MLVVHADKIPLTERKDRQRDGKFIERRLLEGAEGSFDNFQFTLVNTGGDFFSPRHRHNFDQFRFQIEGDGGFDRDGVMTPGTVGYFPEGTRYGPQSNKGDLTVLVLQFAGASGNFTCLRTFDTVAGTTSGAFVGKISRPGGNP